LFGTLLAYCYHVKPQWWTKLLKLTLAVGLAPALFLALTPFMTMYGHTKLGIGYSLVYFSYGWILLCFLTAAENTRIAQFCRSHVGSVLAFLGVYSYGIYLWFFDTSALLRQWVFSSPWAAASPELAFLLSLVVSILVASIAGVGATVLVEKPFLALRDKLYPRRVKAAPV
jgi:peptidoglycan/LPS O-acetylase OafA/YrhL